MSGKFTLRYPPEPEETLSGYLMRLAASNHVVVRDLVREICSSSTAMAHFDDVDSYPGKFDIDALCRICGQDKELLLNSTCMPLYQKFFDKARFSLDLSYKNVVLGQLVDHNRRFCPQCLSDYCEKGKVGVFKLIWQIKPVVICPIHKTSLVSHCEICGHEQQYDSSGLDRYLCSHCGVSLCNVDISENIDDEEKAKQLETSEYWAYLLDSTKPSLMPHKDIAYESALLILLLYHLRAKDWSFDDKSYRSSVITNTEAMGLFRTFFTTNRPTSTPVTPYILHKYLSRIGMTAEEFFTSTFPDEFGFKVADYVGVDYQNLHSVSAITRKARKKPNG